VAVTSGLRSAEYFSKLYRETFGCKPSADRRQSTDAPVFRERRPRS
jgi:transcriptional regulator GlxA family with amidase domain